MAKTVGIVAPNEMSPDEHLKDIERRLREMGVQSVSMTFDPAVKGMPASEVKKGVAAFFEAYLAGKTTPLMVLDVDTAENLAERDGITVAQAKKKYKNVPLTGEAEPEPVAVKTTVKRILKKPQAESLLKPDEGWPFPNAKPQPPPVGDALL